MSEVDAAVVRRRLLAMRRLLDHLAGLDEITEAALRADLGLRLQVSMAIAQLVTLATETNAHVLAREAGRTPGDVRTGFDDISRLGWLDANLAMALRDSPGMRNLLVHEYVEVDLALLARAIPIAGDAYAAYVRQIAAHLPTW